MPETDFATLINLVGTCAGLLFLILLGVIMVFMRVCRLERLLAVKKAASPSASSENETRQVIESRAGGQFERFLEEDPTRLMLTKKEQSSAFRKWRQEHGMNWSNS